MRKLLKKAGTLLVEKTLLASSLISTLTVFLIVFYLFKEGASIFGKSPIESGYVVVVNKENPLNNLSAEQVKKIFDQQIYNWSEIDRHFDQEVKTFRLSDLKKYATDETLKSDAIDQIINSIIKANKGIIAFLPESLIAEEFNGKSISVQAVSLKSFFTGKFWYPTAHPVAQFGILPLLSGTFLVSFIAILIALPFGLAASVYLSEIASDQVNKLLKPLIELLAGIPSIVYGFFGLVVLVPFIQKVFDLPVGETALSGSIVLAIMALPTIITLSEDAIKNTPDEIKEASLALGASHWQTITRVIVPYSISGIAAATILGISRAIGETMAVLMVTGNAAIIPEGILDPIRTIPATIAAELGEAPQGGIHFMALFTLACFLFLITFIINTLIAWIGNNSRNRN